MYVIERKRFPNGRSSWKINYTFFLYVTYIIITFRIRTHYNFYFSAMFTLHLNRLLILILYYTRQALPLELIILPKSFKDLNVVFFKAEFFWLAFDHWLVLPFLRNCVYFWLPSSSFCVYVLQSICFICSSLCY